MLKLVILQREKVKWYVREIGYIYIYLLKV